MIKLRYSLPFLLGATLSAQAQWAYQPVSFANPTAVFALNLDVVDANTAWLGTQPGGNNYVPSQVARTADGGLTWPVSNLPLLTSNEEVLTGLSAVSPSTAWVTTVVTSATGGAVPARILRTTDAGQTWTVQSGATVFGDRKSFPGFVRFVSATEGVAVGEEIASGTGFEAYTTANAGQTWTRVPAMPTLLADESIVGLSSAVLGNSLWFATSTGRVFRSVNKGQTWAVAQAPGASVGNSTASLAFRDAQNGLFSVLSRRSTAHLLYATADGGATWTTVTYTGPLHGVGLSAVPGTTQYVSTGADLNNGDAGSSYSRDNGRTWVSIENQIDHLTTEFVSPTAGWSARLTSATGLGANKFTSRVLGTRTDAALQAGLQLYPNPTADGRATLRVARPLGSPAQVRVLDATGRLLSQQSWDGAAPLPLDLSRAAAGLYLLEVEGASGVARQKLTRP